MEHETGISDDSEYLEKREGCMLGFFFELE